MSVLGVGIDLCEIARMEKALANPRFGARVFSESERAHIEARGAQSAAGLFAAKEAVAKALGSGFDGFMMDKIEITWDEKGRPGCLLAGGARARFEEIGGRAIHLSITHDGGMAAAVAVLES